MLSVAVTALSQFDMHAYDGPLKVAFSWLPFEIFLFSHPGGAI